MTELSSLSREETLALIEADSESYFKQFFESLKLEARYIEEAFEYGAKPAVNGFTLKLVYSEGGGEGEGEQVERVYALIETDNADTHLAYCELDGAYYSHDGLYWDAMPYVVYPREVVVIKYGKDKPNT
jgi:hypothetical protein